ncbi:hypothetical protein L228DRAFT_45804 [Xylona heveae TC161]|uniref:Uncharacterized protein n=1 Tax=Xylona heveae (strain CBS 132557 / TC161) TaxID=1328760 RepID=A0A164ZUJ5_XYLHT|nr:hypothetical protein L228DRAFT_45804 [Xylona heveae TC161]KZF19545.1 hypothetical protein L228DRAFT_45804 [Xylona heveae TC161]
MTLRSSPSKLLLTLTYNCHASPSSSKKKKNTRAIQPLQTIAPGQTPMGMPVPLSFNSIPLDASQYICPLA